MESSTQKSNSTKNNSPASAITSQAKAPSRTSKWGLILIIFILSTFLGIYGYGSFNSKAKQNAQEKEERAYATQDTGNNFLANYMFTGNRDASSLTPTKANGNEQASFLVDILEPSAPAPFEDKPFPESYEQYVESYEKQSEPPVAPPAPPPQINPMEQMAFNFAQQLQQKRYSDMLQSLDAPSTVPNQSISSKENLQNLRAQQGMVTQGPNAYGYSLAKQQLIAQSNPLQAQQVAYQPQGQGVNGGMGYGGMGYGGMGQGAMVNDYGTTGISSTQTLQAYQGLANPNTTLNTYVEPVLSPFLLRQGVVIPCVLLTGINSDLPGFIQAQVTQDVYDSPLGQHLLIPQGSKIVGQYASAPKMGQQRLMLAFNRVIFPDGKAMSLGAMPGSSLDGYSGFDAEVDNHFWQLMGNAILLGGITAGISISVDEPRDEYGNLTVNGALSQGMGQSIGRVLTEVIERNLVVSPTLKVQPGLEFNVTLIQDIYFPGPYQDNRY